MSSRRHSRRSCRTSSAGEAGTPAASMQRCNARLGRGDYRAALLDHIEARKGAVEDLLLIAAMRGGIGEKGKAAKAAANDSRSAYHSSVTTSKSSAGAPAAVMARSGDRKSTRLNSSHPSISYAVFC